MFQRPNPESIIVKPINSKDFPNAKDEGFKNALHTRDMSHQLRILRYLDQGQ
jgi:hypothetical protein